MNTYQDLLNSQWLANANLQQLRQAGIALGVQNFPQNAAIAQTRALITAHLQATPNTALPQNGPWPQQVPPVPTAPATVTTPWYKRWYVYVIAALVALLLCSICLAAVVIVGFFTRQGSSTLSAPIATLPTPIPNAAVPNSSLPAQPAAWPQTTQEAANLFGGTPDRWETTAEGLGWHLMEAHFRTLINPAGFVLEGYYDTEPGKNPRQFVSVAAVEAQGVTVWGDATPEKLFCAMIGQKYPGLPYNQVSPLIDAIGFQKPVSCP